MKISIGILACSLALTFARADDYKPPVTMGLKYFITLETTHNTADTGVAPEGLVKILKAGPGRWMLVVQVKEPDPKNHGADPTPMWVNFDWVSTIQEEKVLKSVADKKMPVQ